MLVLVETSLILSPKAKLNRLSIACYYSFHLGSFSTLDQSYMTREIYMII
jgi:hypothetical protein